MVRTWPVWCTTAIAECNSGRSGMGKPWQSPPSSLRWVPKGIRTIAPRPRPPRGLAGITPDLAMISWLANQMMVLDASTCMEPGRRMRSSPAPAPLCRPAAGGHVLGAQHRTLAVAHWNPGNASAWQLRAHAKIFSMRASSILPGQPVLGSAQASTGPGPAR